MLKVSNKMFFLPNNPSLGRSKKGLQEELQITTNVFLLCILRLPVLTFLFGWQTKGPVYIYLMDSIVKRSAYLSIWSCLFVCLFACHQVKLQCFSVQKYSWLLLLNCRNIMTFKHHCNMNGASISLHCSINNGLYKMWCKWSLKWDIMDHLTLLCMQELTL